MQLHRLSRRDALARAGTLAGAALAGVASIPGSTSAAEGPAPTKNDASFVFCLNTATIRGQKLGLVKEIDVVAKAGFQAIEPWISSIEEYSRSGGSLKDLKQRIADAGLTVESSIGFAEWLAEDDAKHAQGLERAKRDMDLVAQIGGKRMAAPPAGATNTPGLDLLNAAGRYRALLDAGDQAGVVPQLELWGFSKNLHRLGECACVAIETGHPQACVLVDVFHLYTSGSSVNSLGLLSGRAMQVFHLNDYPAEPPREKINDGFRIFPGDGVAPLTQILRSLHATGGRKVLSLELFNKEYWSQDPLTVAKAGLEKMRAAVAKATG